MQLSALFFALVF